MPTGFKYTMDDNTAPNRYRHFLTLSQGQTKMGEFTLDEGDLGAFSVTGIGFQPEALLLFGVLLSPNNEDDFDDFGCLHLGMAAGTDEWGMGIAFDYLGGFGAHPAAHKGDKIIAAAFGSGGVYLEANLTSFDADGFTINVTTSGAGAGSGSVDFGAAEDNERILYLAMRGGGGYACGTTLGNSANGLQAISGLGFPPSAIFFATTQQPSLGSTNAFARMGLGGGGDTSRQYVAWTGAKTGDTYTDNAIRQNLVISMMEDADGGGPFQPTPQCEAELQSLDTDGFTLDWTTTDGTARYFSWFAVENGQVGRLQDSTPGISPYFVATAKKPRGLIFFQTDRDSYSLDHNTSTFGGSIGLGVCDQSLGQYLASTGVGSAFDFGGIAQGVRTAMDGVAFGSYEGEEGGIAMPNHPRDRGVITLFVGSKPQVMRYR